jgi:SAM-dependent methyltransferase
VIEDFDPARSFGREVSMRYDGPRGRGDEEATVAFLARLAGQAQPGTRQPGTRRPGSLEPVALELAIGTGRVALPLAQAGVRVDGIELSPDMVDRMREKPGGDAIEVTIGDMSRVTTGKAYGLVYLVFNTIGNLLTQDDQVRCFENAARHLAPGGSFVLECGVPDAMARRDRDYVRAEYIALDEVGLEACRYDPVTQVIDKSHVTLGASGVRVSPISLRLARPPEFDLMARIAGLRLRARWGGWEGEPFTAQSERHVSVYERAA